MNVLLRTVGFLVFGGCVGLLLLAQQQQAEAQTSSPLANSGQTAGSPVHQMRTSSAPMAQHYEARRRPYRPSFFGFGRGPSQAMGFSPRHQRVGGNMLQESAGDNVSEEIFYEEAGAEILPGNHHHAADGGCTSCGSGPRGPHQSGCMLPCPWLNLDNLEVFAGAHGFKSPANRGRDGSFGFYEGLNYTTPLPCNPWNDINMQIGAMVSQSNLSGASFTNAERSQIFLTAGIYRRVDWGLQWGAVFDYLHDEWDATFDVSQIRGEISWVYPCNSEIGFMTAVSARDVDVNLPTIGPTTLETTDIFAFFYRHQFEERFGGGEGRVFGGISGQSDAIVGGDVLMPISDRLAISGEFTYLIPDEGTVAGGGVGSGNFGESWNVAVGLVWYPGRCKSQCGNRYNRPLFDVANNGSMLLNNR